MQEGCEREQSEHAAAIRALHPRRRFPHSLLQSRLLSIHHAAVAVPRIQRDGAFVARACQLPRRPCLLHQEVSRVFCGYCARRRPRPQVPPAPALRVDVDRGVNTCCSVATSAQQPLLLQVGGASARQGDKLQRLPDVTRCCFANAKAAAAAVAAAVAAAASGSHRSRNAFAALAADSDDAEDSNEQQQQQPSNAVTDPLFFITSSCAHLLAQVLHVTDAADAGHALVTAQVKRRTESSYRTPVKNTAHTVM